MSQREDVIIFEPPADGTANESVERVLSDLRAGRLAFEDRYLYKLRQNNLIDDRWALEFLDIRQKEPDISAHIRFPFHSQEMHYMAGAGNGLLCSVDSRGGVAIKREFSVSGFIGELLGPFHSPHAAPPPPFEVVLSEHGLHALFQLVDWLRGLILASLLRGAPLPSFMFAPEDLGTSVESDATSTDNRSFRRLATMFSDQERGNRTPDALAELQELGLIARVEAGAGAYEPMAAVLDLANRFVNPTPAFVLKPGKKGRKKGIPDTYGIIGGWSLLRVMSSTDGADQAYVLKALDGLDATVELLAVIGTSCGLETQRDPSGSPGA
ncbi:hypothetical protein [Roseovarius ramblicola]|uniref:Uncharacterized protein n=1 Tax=Roseovarius ramblicola TaxID=2022336 RepID=A0ABV5HWU3_9RHOB